MGVLTEIRKVTGEAVRNFVRGVATPPSVDSSSVIGITPSSPSTTKGVDTIPPDPNDPFTVINPLRAGKGELDAGELVQRGLTEEQIKALVGRINPVIQTTITDGKIFSPPFRLKKP